MMESVVKLVKIQREADRQKFADLLNQFPNYHGPGYNYTKEEVESWLKKAHALVESKPIEGKQP